jgi:hypothetical protein
MAVIDAIALVQHIFGLCGFGVVGVILVNVGPHICEEVGAIASLLEIGAKASKIPLMGRELLTEEGQVVLFQGGGGESGFGIEEAAELTDDVVAL